MSDVLTVLEPARDGGKPLLLVRCAGCGREYQVRCDKKQAEKAKRCWGCRLFSGRPGVRVTFPNAKRLKPDGRSPREVPTWRLTCPDCGAERVVCCWPRNIRRSNGRCIPCGMRARLRKTLPAAKGLVKT